MSKSYIKEYNEKLISAKEAAQFIKSDDWILYGSFLGRPIDFDNELAQRKEELRDVDIFLCTSLLPVMNTAVSDPVHKHFTCTNFYFSAIDRKMADNNMMFYLPAHLSEANSVMEKDTYPPYTCVQQVSPMDEHGFFSFGATNVYSYSACANASRVILEVNENMPRVSGGSEEALHISMVDHIIEGSNTPLFEVPPAPEPSEADCAIASLLMEEIEDRACLQLGIGTLPDLLGNLMCESDLKDLGIHTEMFVNSMVDLFEKGLVTNRYKTTDRGKIAFTFCLGTNETYDFINNNPLMASHPAGYCNSPRIIGLNDKVVSINNAIQIDLTAQVCAESSGTRQISGTGGQLDFVNGANLSNGGKSFICLSSTFTDKEGELHSRIVPILEPGSIVTTPRTSVDYIVTEYGKAQLKGQPVWARVDSLINLAHPKFRDDLIKEAEKMKIWRRTHKHL